MTDCAFGHELSATPRMALRFCFSQRSSRIFFANSAVSFCSCFLEPLTAEIAKGVQGRREKLFPSSDWLSDTRIAGELRSLVSGLPGEVGIAATEVSVSGSLLVNRTPQVQRFDNPARRQLE